MFFLHILTFLFWAAKIQQNLHISKFYAKFRVWRVFSLRLVTCTTPYTKATQIARNRLRLVSKRNAYARTYYYAGKDPRLRVARPPAWRCQSISQSQRTRKNPSRCRNGKDYFFFFFFLLRVCICIYKIIFLRSKTLKKKKKYRALCVPIRYLRI